MGCVFNRLREDSTMSPSIRTLSLAAYRRAVAIRDLTDPGQGPHALQLLVEAAIYALSKAWRVPALLHRANPVIPIEDNYDRLGYPPEGSARDARYTRYVSDQLLLRTQTSAMIPAALERLSLSDAEPDWLVACPGIVYRRDEIDRLHSGEPHQLDLWRVRRGAALGRDDLHEMVDCLLSALLPGLTYRLLPAQHPYTLDGLQIDVRHLDQWVEVGECGLAHPRVLGSSGWPCPPHSGLALGVGLDRSLMLRKRVPDIRLLRATEPRVASQMLDLSPYRPVSPMPSIARDLSLMVPEDLSMEEVGDRIRTALGVRAAVIEAIERRSETPYGELPPQAIARMGALPGQKNLLLRVILRDLERNLTHAEANSLRDAMYRELHSGQRRELVVPESVVQAK
jgi:phenylalanyl-tRNA synthetase alpha chain